MTSPDKLWGEGIAGGAMGGEKADEGASEKPDEKVDEKAGEKAGEKTAAPSDGAAGLSSPPPGEPAALAEGVVLASKYRLVKELGSGGMGTVWVAHNLALDFDVAVKVLRGDSKNPNLPDRLMREARALARLGHPGIVRVFDVGNAANGMPFLVMELLRGVDLRRTLSGHEGLDATTVVRMLLPIAHALASAHEAGIVHRDLKPENIFLSKQSGSPIRPILLDFGIARSWGEPSHRLTLEGAIVGSPESMSPEQARGEEVTHRGDIWAFSVVLYESVTGRVPFSNTSFLRLQRDIIEKPAPTFAQLGIAEDALWRIVERGLEKKPQHRWHSMRTMGVELARWLLGKGIEEDVTNASIRATWLKVDRKAEVPDVSLDAFSSHEMPFAETTVRLRRWYVSHRVGRLCLVGLLLAATGAILWRMFGPRHRNGPTPIVQNAPNMEPKKPPAAIAGAGPDVEIKKSAGMADMIQAPAVTNTHAAENPSTKGKTGRRVKLSSATAPAAAPTKSNPAAPEPAGASTASDPAPPVTAPFDIKTDF
jgi:eukaryotic-like serine/threonine-protein kinase